MCYYYDIFYIKGFDKMKLKKVNYKEFVLDESSTIKKSTIRPVENNVGYDKVTITPKQAKK